MSSVTARYVKREDTAIADMSAQTMIGYALDFSVKVGSVQLLLGIESR
jgi:hypothetical protein